MSLLNGKKIYGFLVGSYFFSTAISFAVSTAIGAYSLALLGWFVLGTTAGSSIASIAESVPTQIFLRFPDFDQTASFKVGKVKYIWIMGKLSLYLSIFTAILCIITTILPLSEPINVFIIGLAYSCFQLKLNNSYLILSTLKTVFYAAKYRVFLLLLAICMASSIIIARINFGLEPDAIIKIFAIILAAGNILPCFIKDNDLCLNVEKESSIKDEVQSKAKYSRNLYWQLVANILSQNMDKWLIAAILNSGTLGLYSYLIQCMHNPAVMVGNAWSEKNYKNIFERKSDEGPYQGITKFLSLTTLISAAGLCIAISLMKDFSFDVPFDKTLFIPAILILLKTQVDILSARLSLHCLAKYKSYSVTMSDWSRFMVILMAAALASISPLITNNISYLCLLFLIGSLLSAIVLIVHLNRHDKAYRLPA